MATIPEDKVAYVDEMGICEHLHRAKGRAKRGAKVYDAVSGRKFLRLNIVAGQCLDRVIAPMEYSGTTDHVVFETWFAKRFLPQLGEGFTIVMDNASFHRKKALAELARQAKCRLLFLPAYSPDLNPIEKRWANMKTFLRNYSAPFGNLHKAIKDYFKVE
jgi:transposase